MVKPTQANDDRGPDRRLRDEQIASQPKLAPCSLPSQAVAAPMEKYLKKKSCHPFAVAGIVENGLVRPLDPSVNLPEHSRVIIVAEAK